jgi:hypothetical protein
MESLQFVGCSWFIGLIGLVFDSPEIKATENRICVHPCSSPVSSRPQLDAPGVHSTAFGTQNVWNRCDRVPLELVSIPSRPQAQSESGPGEQVPARMFES